MNLRNAILSSLAVILPVAAQPPFEPDGCHAFGETITATGSFAGWAAFNPFIPFAQRFCIRGYNGPLLPIRGDHMADDPLKTLPFSDYATVTGELGRSGNGTATLTITSVQDVDASLKARIAEWNQGCSQWQEETISSTFPGIKDKGPGTPAADPFSHGGLLGNREPTRDDIKRTMGLSRPAGNACGISASNIAGLPQTWAHWRSREEDLQSWININAMPGATSLAIPLTRVEPGYTEEMRRANFNGEVKAVVAIDDHGKVVQVTVIAPPFPGVEAAIVDALKQWRFAPAMKGGVPVSSQAMITESFTRR